MTVLEQFPECTQANVLLGPYTQLRLGGPAEFLVQPRSVTELTDVLTWCRSNNTPVRVLGSGVNLLVRDEPVAGVVLRLLASAFTDIVVNGTSVRAGCGAKLAALISATAQHGLAGMETLIGIPATVGGALRCNAGDRSGEIGAFVRRVEVLDEAGRVATRERDELRFGEHSSNLDDKVLLTAEFTLHKDSADAIVKRMRTAWIQRRAQQPYPFEASARVFLNPRGGLAHELLDKAGVARTKVGGAEVSDRNSNYIVTKSGATARDVIRLMDVMKSKVRDTSGIDLETELVVW